MDTNSDGEIQIYLHDLKEEVQSQVLDEKGSDEGNMDVVPLAIIPTR